MSLKAAALFAPTFLAGLMAPPSRMLCQSSNRLSLSRPTSLLNTSDERINVDGNLRAAIGSDGRIAVAEGGGAYVGLIDARGRLQRVGREGGGPGEFRGGLRVSWRRDTLVVTDANARRTTLFSGGRVVQTVSFLGTASKNGSLETPLFLTEKGAVCPVIGGRSARDFGPQATPLVLASVDGRELIDTLFPLNEPLGRLVIQRASSTTILLQPFSASTIVASNGVGTYFAKVERDARAGVGGLTGSAGTVSLFSADGRPVYSTAVPFRMRRLDSKVVEYVIDTILEPINRHRKGTARITREDYRRALITPPFLPSVAGAIVSNDGSLLLREWTVPSDSADYLVLDKHGKTRGFIRVASSQQVIAADERQVVLVGERPDGDWELSRAFWEKSSRQRSPSRQ